MKEAKNIVIKIAGERKRKIILKFLALYLYRNRLFTYYHHNYYY